MGCRVCVAALYTNSGLLRGKTEERQDADLRHLFPFSVGPSDGRQMPRASPRLYRPRGLRRGRASRLAPGGHDLNRWGAKDALPGHLRRPLDAWPAWPPCRAGYRRPASLLPAPPCPRACVEGTGGTGVRPLASRSSPLSRRWRDGPDPGTPGPALGWSVRHAGRGIGLQPPAPALGRGPAGEPPSHLRGVRTIANRRAAVIRRTHTL
jgi:hypothetical protein